MVRVRTIRWALLVFGMSVCAAAQNNPPSQPETTPVPPFGQNAPVLNPENPPVTRLDEPDPRSAQGHPKFRLASIAGE